MGYVDKAVKKASLAHQFDDIPVAIQNNTDFKIDKTPTTSKNKPLKGPTGAVYANTGSPEEDGLNYNSEPLHRELKRTEIRLIAVDKLRKFVRDNYQNKTIFQQEFDKIPYGLQHPTIVASSATDKNRYKEMYAYDHSRVILRRIADEPHSDYINACHVNGYTEEKKYIASQGPVNPMVGDFWRMVWEQDVCIIVMTTKLVEEGKMKLTIVFVSAVSAGVGRTGTFIAMDYLYDQGKETGNIDIPQCVTNLRAHRVNMVQTVSQYRYLYKLILEMLVLPSQPVTTEQLSGENMGLKEQYLDLSTEESLFPDDNTYYSATTNENQSKNRSMDILAGDNYRPYLSSHIPNTTDYINAVIMPAKTKQSRFLIVYTGWSENMELPQSPRSFMDLLRHVRNVTSEAPILVQCLNGADKSGLFVVIWTLLEHLEIDGEVSIPRVVRHLRLRRKQIVPTFDQFKFCADCIAKDDANTYVNFQKKSS
ncbi:hypothetical protein DPMN_028034 [Dreissena polymorpha]|uniref:protein-tyrosine-phosphatase n=1 Tax=Dreissena polymorpha TaxID=45954 RepID=A0A9D4LVI5_DREPO|nr:hypothetical protein DPMN_028034 [Dreissena polymorpha]